MNKPNPTPSPQEPEETTAEMLSDVLRLVEETTARITDEDVEAKLRQLLQGEESEDGGSGPQPVSSQLSAVCEESSTGTSDQPKASDLVDLDRVAFELCMRPVSLLTLVAQRHAAGITAAARREAEEHRNAALTQSAQIVKEAREEAEEILRHARKEAARLVPTDTDAGDNAVEPTRSLSWLGRRWRAYATSRWAITVMPAVCVMAGLGAAVAVGQAAVVVFVGLTLLAVTPIVGLTYALTRLTTRRLQVSTAVAMRSLATVPRLADAALRIYMTHPPSCGQHDDESSIDSFWKSLTGTEQNTLMRLAQQRTFSAGTMMCREGEPADRLWIIRSGWVKVSVDQDGRDRVIGFRGPGDLIGERAALRVVGSRSAEVVSVETVRAFEMSVESFADFLSVHPRVLTLVEGQVYKRLTEGIHGSLSDKSRTETSRAPSWSGQNCTIVVADIVEFGAPTRHDEDRRIIRQVMYELLRAAFEGSGIPREVCHWEDRGDGALIVVPPIVPTSSVIDPLVVRLSAGLGRHNRGASAAARLRLRMAVHVGPVVRDAEGVSGQAIIHAARLLDAPAFKKQLAETSAHLGFIASSFVYDIVIRHNPYVDPGEYRRLQFKSKDAATTAWMNLLGGTGVGSETVAGAPSMPFSVGDVTAMPERSSFGAAG